MGAEVSGPNACTAVPLTAHALFCLEPSTPTTPYFDLDCLPSVDGQRFRAHHSFPPIPLTAPPVALVALRSCCSLPLCLTLKPLLPSKEGFFLSLSWSQARQQHTLNPLASASRVLALQMCATVMDMDMERLGLNFDKGSRITFNHPPLASVFISVEGTLLQNYDNI